MIFFAATDIPIKLILFIAFAIFAVISNWLKKRKQQGEAATAAKQLADGQSVVLNTLQKKLTDASGVNIDVKMM